MWENSLDKNQILRSMLANVEHLLFFASLLNHRKILNFRYFFAVLM